MANRDEKPSDWTEPLITRVSKRASKAIEDKLNALQGVSRSAYLRQLVYRDLGFLQTPPPEKP